MKHSFKSLLCLLLCLSLCLGFAVPVLAADDGFTAVLSKDTVTAGKEQTVTLTVTADTPRDVAAIGADLVWDDTLTLTAVKNAQISTLEGDVNLSTGAIAWMNDAMNEEGTAVETLSGITEIATLTFTVPASAKPGVYKVGLENIILSDGSGSALIAGEDSAYATLTVEAADEPVVSDGYAAKLTTGTPSPVREEQVVVNVGVTRENQDTFAAGELSVTFDKTMLAYSSASLDTVSLTDNGDGTSTLKLADYGADKALSDAVYTLTFDTLVAGETTLTLSDAGFTDKENAATDDLLAVSEDVLEAGALTLNILKKTFEVDLPAEFNGPAIATEGEDYVFTQANPHYNIGSVTFVFADGTEAEAQYDADSVAFTIPGSAINSAITGIRVEKTGVTYGVTFDDVQPAAKPDKNPTYMTDYVFTLPADVAPYTNEGVTYSVTRVTVNGQEITGSLSGREYTIPGEKITGDLVITITGAPVASTHVTVKVEDTTGNVVSQTSSPLNKGNSAVLVLKQEKGYVYTVTYTLGGGEAQPLTGVQNEDGNYVYTVENVQSSLVFTAGKTPDVSKVASAEYLTLDKTTVWLITNGIVLEEGSKATYDGADMFWSDRYKAYCYLVIAPTDPLNTALVGIAQGQAPAVDYGMDVNKSGKVDASDAQLVYNMYQSAYEAFDETVTMEKFLRADVGGAAGIVDVNDAVTIINHILGIQASAE